MYKYLVKDNYKRYRFKKKEIKINLYKFIFENPDIKLEQKYWIYFKFIRENPYKFTSTLIKNRCVLTSRSRSIRRFTKLSRIQFKKLGSDGLLAGISKST
jgi:small subunit ribosomal protein S14